MNHYHNFRIASYMYAYYAAEAEDAKIREDMEKYLKYLPLDKVYVENHRGLVDVPVKRLREIKAILEEYGVKVPGGITSTGLVNGVQKPALFDTFCYTDPEHRREYLRIVSEAAEVFDEIILDDYFFTSCRCEMCIAAKGSRSWKDFRQAQMLEFSSEIVSLAKSVNPNITFIIKYPNWYESYQATGYNPGMQKDVLIWCIRVPKPGNLFIRHSTCSVTNPTVRSGFWKTRHRAGTAVAGSIRLAVRTT